jgi:antitoxin CptB
MLPDDELKRLRWRATHRGTREADLLVGGFFDAHHLAWGPLERATFAAMLEEQDADKLAMSEGSAPPPARFEGPMMEALKRLDYIPVRK